MRVFERPCSSALALTGLECGLCSVDEAAREVERQAKAAGSGDLGTENLLRSVRELRRVRRPGLHLRLCQVFVSIM